MKKQKTIELDPEFILALDLAKQIDDIEPLKKTVSYRAMLAAGATPQQLDDICTAIMRERPSITAEMRATIQMIRGKN